MQKTIRHEGRLSGRGLFFGQEAHVVFRPAAPDTGIVFVRTDLEHPVRIPVCPESIVPRPRRSALGRGDAVVETSEHFLAAAAALGLDNLIVEIDALEMPGFDGSSEEYFKTLQKCETAEQNKPRRELIIREPLCLQDGDRSIYALPDAAGGLHLTFDMDYTQHTGIGRQTYSCSLTESHFAQHLAPARTFLLEAEARQMQAAGFGTHLSPRQILVISSDGPIRNSYRFPDECVRHKIVDLIGDLMLAGMPIVGRIVAYKSGHTLNQQLVKTLIEQDKKHRGLDSAGKPVLDIRRIQKILPHRYPFLLVDKVIEVEEDRRITAIKNVTINEHFFQGHFPGAPVMPGVLIVEAMAQVCGLLFAQTLEHTGKMAVLLTMDQVKIRKSVVPGDQLILTAEADKIRSRAAKCNCTARVGEEIVAEAQLKFMLVDDEVR